ncbi:MAG: hypothetical protein PVG42_07735, partial [Lysobacterales bacterium]
MKNGAADNYYRPTGRPTLYRPIYCQQVLDYFDVQPYREITRISRHTGREYTQRGANDRAPCAAHSGQAPATVLTS